MTGAGPYPKRKLPNMATHLKSRGRVEVEPVALLSRLSLPFRDHLQNLQHILYISLYLSSCTFLDEMGVAGLWDVCPMRSLFRIPLISLWL